MNTLKLLLIPALVAALGVGVTVVQASSSNGKPFVELEGQIVEVQGAVASFQEQIDEIVGNVESIEQRLDADADAIVRLEAEIDALTASIEANEGDIEALYAQVDHNVDLIEAIHSEMVEIQEQLDLKQDLVDGRCPDGSAIQELLPDGSIACEDVGVGSLQRVVMWTPVPTDVYSGQRRTIEIPCPEGYGVVSGGYHAFGGTAYASRPVTRYEATRAIWEVRVENARTYTIEAYGYAVCLAGVDYL